jgi:hypothetical protein
MSCTKDMISESEGESQTSIRLLTRFIELYRIVSWLQQHLNRSMPWASDLGELSRLLYLMEWL